MSLINDALKRAKEAQAENQSAPPPLQFRAAEPSQRASAGSPILLILGAIIALGLVGLLAAVVFHKRAAARPISDVAAMQTTAPDTATLTPMLQPAAESATSGGSTGSANPGAAAVTAPTAAGTNEVVAAEATVTEPPPLPRLQGIFYRPGRPSAVVNGKNVYIGNKVGEFQILAISHESVIIVSGTQTNVLTLE